MVSLSTKEKVFKNRDHLLSFFGEERSFPLNSQEQQINDLLEDLPSFCLTDNRTPKWKQKLLNGAMAITAVLGISSPFLVLSYLLKSSVSNGLGFAFMFGNVFVAFFLMRCLSRIYDRFKISCTHKDAVLRRQETIKKASRWVRSPFLKGRLAEVYFLVSHEDIDRHFWDKLIDQLNAFVLHMEKQNHQAVEDDEMKELRGYYRNMILSVENVK